MYYYDQVVTNKQERKHFNSLDMDKLRTWHTYTIDEITQKCNEYLKDILTLYYWEDLGEDSKELQLNDIFRKGPEEPFVEGYKRLLQRVLIFDPKTEKDVRKELIDTHHNRRGLLYYAQANEIEDNLDDFFNYVKEEKELWFEELNYLKSKLLWAISDFDDTREQDVRLRIVLNKLYGDDNRPLDYQYENLWNKKLAWWIRSKEEHIFIINSIIECLTRKEVREFTLNYDFSWIIWAKLSTQYEYMKEQKAIEAGTQEHQELQSSPQKKRIFLNLYWYLPKDFFLRKKNICYPGSSTDVSLSDVFGSWHDNNSYHSYLPHIKSKDVVHIDNEEWTVASLKKHWYIVLHEDIAAHDKQYDFVFDSNCQTSEQALDRLVKPWWYILVENAHTHAHYFYNSGKYTFVANIDNWEKVYKENADYYLFKKHESNRLSIISWTKTEQWRLSF